MKFISTFLAVSLLSIGSAAAASPKPDLSGLDTKDLLRQVDEWLSGEIVSLSIDAQNKRYGKLSEQQITDLDNKWRSENESNDKPLISATLSSPLSVYLTRMQGQSYGLFVEIFVMDNKGLNVGQSSITSDFWQGDEAKFQKTYDVGPDAVFVDEPEYDETLGIWRVQMSKSIKHPKSNELIGAATIEVNLTELARRQQLASK
ncbi:hypothetical protein [uncultured Cohaesibacter sp.]|uniref:hypothetical protein n=1 Tax=uncultured Cohaesibacter sp. TaxID=1002546 RepID=UPI0029C63316|nr:hypothetical protein [uncultured Cohaesibacter sp.]